jgi:rubrerythrin
MDLPEGGRAGAPAAPALASPGPLAYDGLYQPNADSHPTGGAMPDQATDKERVEFALRTERDGNSFYEDAAKRTGHKLARAAFEILAKEEVRHAALIEALGKKLDGEGGPIDPESPSLKNLQFSIKTIYEGAGDQEQKGELEPADAYRQAIELEKKISALYYRYGDESESDVAKRLFSVLYREEQDHLTLLEDMLAYLTKPDDWFIDRDMVMLDGG